MEYIKNSKNICIEEVDNGYVIYYTKFGELKAIKQSKLFKITEEEVIEHVVANIIKDKF